MNQLPAWLLWLLGIDAESAQSDGSWRIEFLSRPEGPWAVAAVAATVALVVGVWYLYRKEGRATSRAARTALAALRCGIFALVALMLLEAVLVRAESELVPSVLLVLFDTSQSMALKDPYPDPDIAAATARSLELLNENGQPDVQRLREQTRLQLARRALGPQWEALADGRRLSLRQFSAQSETLADVAAVEDLTPDGGGTAIGDALADALAAHRGQPIAGVVLVTEGQSNAGVDALSVAAQAAKAAVPIFPLAVGTEQGPRDAKVATLEAGGGIVFVNDPMQLVAHVESTGLAGESFGVVLERRGDDGDWVRVSREEITADEDGRKQRVEFPPYNAKEPGEVLFRARLEVIPGEIDAANNIALAKVRVVRQTVRVLLIAGSPSPEMQFMRNALLRDKTLEFASWLQSADKGYKHVGSQPIRRLPATQTELNHYDVLVMLDPDVAALGSHWPEMLVRFVNDAGGGLIYVAGEMHSNETFDPAAGGLADEGSWTKLLPIVRRSGLFSTAAGLRLSARRTWALEVTAQGLEETLFRFSPQAARNRQILASLPGMYWHFPVTRAKPAATVLARHGDPRMSNEFGRHVLVATQFFGRGRTVFIGFDATHRWRYLSEGYFDGFWTRLIGEVGRRKVLLAGGHPLRLSTDRSGYRVGMRVTVRAEFVSASDVASGLPSLVAELEVGDRPPMPVEFQPLGGEQGVWEASFEAEHHGQYLLRVLPGDATELESGARAAMLSFKVAQPRRELDNYKLNRELLEALAQRSGGRVFSLAEASQIPDAIEMKQVERPLVFRHELWDAPIFYIAIMCLLTVEWLLRKKNRMA